MLGTFGWVSSWPSGLSLPILPLSVLWRWYMELCIRWDCVWAAKDGSFSDWTYMISTILQVQSKLQPSWRRKAGRLAANQKVTGLVRWLAACAPYVKCVVITQVPFIGSAASDSLKETKPLLSSIWTCQRDGDESYTSWLWVWLNARWLKRWMLTSFGIEIAFMASCDASFGRAWRSVVCFLYANEFLISNICSSNLFPPDGGFALPTSTVPQKAEGQWIWWVIWPLVYVLY